MSKKFKCHFSSYIDALATDLLACQAQAKFIPKVNERYYYYNFAYNVMESDVFYENSGHMYKLRIGNCFKSDSIISYEERQSIIKNMEKVLVDKCPNLTGNTGSKNSNPTGSWIPKEGDDYYYYDLDHRKVFHMSYNGFGLGRDRIAIGNCFRTKEEITDKVLFKVLKKLKKFNKVNGFGLEGK